MNIEISKGCLKKRQGKYVVYDVDFLLTHLASEVALLWDAKQFKVKPFNKQFLKDMKDVIYREDGTE